MKKFLIGVALASLISTPVLAQGRHHRGHHGGHHHHHHRGHNPAPYILGAMGLAILGGIIYDQYGRRCYNQIIGRDAWGDPVTRRICE